MSTTRVDDQALNAMNYNFVTMKYAFQMVFSGHTYPMHVSYVWRTVRHYCQQNVYDL
jgi:hypothetical protein